MRASFRAALLDPNSGLVLDPAPGGVVEIATDDLGDATALLGVPLAYQPGEYQPNALDDLGGNNFQILANAIVFAAGQAPAAVALLALLLVAARSIP